MDTPEWWDLPYAESASPNAQFVRLHEAPRTPPGDVHGTVIVLHGGYWKNKFGLDDEYGNAGTKSLGSFFWARGFSVVEVEYRRRDHEGGGWPGTNEDVLLAIDFLCRLSREAQAQRSSDSDKKAVALRSLRSERLILLGHSAGGCLALWAAHKLAARGLQPIVVASAPVADLIRGYELKVSDEGDAVERYMKQAPTASGLEEYRKASPAALLPVTFPLCVVYGDSDTDVPPDLVRAYAKDAKASAPALVSVLEIPGADHFQIVDARTDIWLARIVPVLREMIGQHFGQAAASTLE
ncbi:unnamed protein product [Symbiodinium necroappetens]|uniref:Peptidase S9 prolyl oligopeptidase catalytic domain-containing protein n=1 Tax=Symbiodinium necroappetens TaxID=1628268 RepID=A0A813ATR1_9DINO|nr:unnamed protein product [Symbiodinium necroappetens]